MASSSAVNQPSSSSISPPGTVTQTVSGTAQGTSTIPASGTVPGTVIVTTCTLTPTTTTVRANNERGADSTIPVPACATAATFSVAGGSGGNPGESSGNGAIVRGRQAVMPGQLLTFIAGGQGTINNTGGTSAYGNGGDGSIGHGGGGGGGGASALRLDANLLAVAGGGGGGCSPAYTISPNGTLLAPPQSGSNETGNGGGYVGFTRYVGNSTSYTVISRGGGGGSQTTPGAGGTYGGEYKNATNGDPGRGSDGGNSAFLLDRRRFGSSGGGGGGYRGGGSGAATYVQYTDGRFNFICGGGGGGSNFVSPGVTDSSQSVAGDSAPGSVEVSFS